MMECRTQLSSNELKSFPNFDQDNHCYQSEKYKTAYVRNKSRLIHPLHKGQGDRLQEFIYPM